MTAESCMSRWEMRRASAADPGSAGPSHESKQRIVSPALNLFPRRQTYRCGCQSSTLQALKRAAHSYFLECGARGAASGAKRVLRGLPVSGPYALRSSPTSGGQSRLDRETRTHNPANRGVPGTGGNRAAVLRASRSAPARQEPSLPYWLANCSSGSLNETLRADGGSSPCAIRSAITSIARRSALLMASSLLWP